MACGRHPAGTHLYDLPSDFVPGIAKRYIANHLEAEYYLFDGSIGPYSHKRSGKKESGDIERCWTRLYAFGAYDLGSNMCFQLN